MDDRQEVGRVNPVGKTIYAERQITQIMKENPKMIQQGKVYRVRLIDGLSVLWTSLIVVALGVGIAALQFIGWFDTIIGAVLSVVFGLIFCTMVVDLAMLLTSCVTIADGMINAGKDEQGNVLMFHLANIVDIQLRDKQDQIVTEDRRRYTGVYLTFVMESGRINRRAPRNYTQKQIDRIRAAVKACT